MLEELIDNKDKNDKSKGFCSQSTMRNVFFNRASHQYIWLTEHRTQGYEK